MYFRIDVIDLLSQIVSEKLPVCPQLCILCLFPEGFYFNEILKKSIVFCKLKTQL